MSTWLRYFSFWRRDPRLDAPDEIRFHLEMRVADLVARGMSAAAARREAEREFGDMREVQRQLERIDTRIIRREQRAEWWSEVARDVRVGFRSLRRSPGFTATAVLCAALGIGVTAAIVSASYAILLRPLPYRDADRLIAVYSENTARGIRGGNISWPGYLAWRDQNRSLSALGIWTWGTRTLSGGDAEAERVDGANVSANLFPLLGVHPTHGRLFAPGEDGERANPGVVLLSDAVWRRRYGGDPGIAGKTITVDGRPTTVIGVMPRGFSFPDRGEIWTPFTVDPANEEHGNRYHAGALGRIRPGATIDDARADLHRIDANLEAQYPTINRGWRADVVALRDDLVGELRQPLKVFLWAVALVLLMVCANIANLMLARGAMRSREIAVRSALGATRGRLGRQLMTESFVVAGVGGVLGVVVAWWGVRLLRFAFPGEAPPFFIDLSLDGTALLIVVVIAVVTGIVFGALPAIRGTRVDLNSELRDGARGAGHGLHRSRLRGALVAAEVGLSVILMIGALLLVRSYRNLQGTDLGFDEAGIVSARLSLPSAQYPTRAHAVQFYERLFERLRAVPDIQLVGAAQGIPFSGWNVKSVVAADGAPPLRPGEGADTHHQSVTPDYFKAIGVSLLRGRWLTDADRDSLTRAALVNEQFVRQVFDGDDPIGKRVALGRSRSAEAVIVGVIRDFRHYQLPEPMGPALYYSFASQPRNQQTIVLRARHGDAAALIPTLRAAVRALDPTIALYNVQTIDEVVARSLWRQRLQGSVVSIFAVLALVLASIGLYGVVSYAVAQRTRELGVRIALGATRRNVVFMVVGQSGRLVVLGVVLGLAGAWFGMRILDSLLYGVGTTDLATFASVPVLIGLVALLAAVVPARRATKVDPLIAMRAE